MQRAIALRLTAAVWIANVGITALAIYGLEHPQPYVAAADAWRPTETRYKLAEDTKAEPDQPAALVMPMDTIVAADHGRALMQGAPDVVIGPGTVTYPATNPPRPGH
ncbi:MAG TPA: hypothetical protein VF765_06020 [Polyangiaceae bacterium]